MTPDAALEGLPAGLKLIAYIAILLGSGFMGALAIRDRWAKAIKAEVTAETDAKIAKLEARLNELEHACTQARALNVKAVSLVAKLEGPEAEKAMDALQQQAAILG